MLGTVRVLSLVQRAREELMAMEEAGILAVSNML
jgi:hypothetical protein